MFRGLKEANCCARGRAHSGLASSNPLCVFQESLCRAQRPGVSTLRSTATPVLRSSPATEDGEDGRRPSAAFPRAISNCAWVNWNCYTIPISVFGLISAYTILGHLDSLSGRQAGWRNSVFKPGTQWPWFAFPEFRIRLKVDFVQCRAKVSLSVESRALPKSASNAGRLACLAADL